MKSITAFLSDLIVTVKKGLRKHRKGIRNLLLLVGAVFVVLSVIGYKVSETPWFCGVCHNMQPYIDSWKVSSHKEVGCIECHYKPGFLNHVKGKMTDGQVSLVYFLTGKTPGKYHAVISDAACLQCHQPESLSSDKEFRGITFSHSNHLEELRRGKKLRCTTCHGQIVQGEHITVDTKDCFICHFKPESDGSRHPVLAACDTCHSEVPLEIEISGRVFHHQRYIDDGIDCNQCHVDIIEGDGTMIENKCVECHNEPQFITENFSAEALHLNHVTDHKVECWHCHREISHEIVRNPTTSEFETKCTTCHEDRQHIGPREMYMGTGGIGVADTPAVMFLANVDCSSCHSKTEADAHSLHSVDYEQLALGEACNSCHGPGYDSMLMRWKEVLTKEINDSNNRVFLAQKILFEAKKEFQGEEYRRAQQLVAEARHNLNFVILGGGQHNIEYALKLLNVARAKVEAAKQILVPNYKPVEIETVEYSCATLCHTEMASRKVMIGQTNYPHKTHIEDLGLSCTDCHSDLESHGQTRLDLCMDCHHGTGEGDVRCEDCHQSVGNLFAGKSANGVQGKASPKYGILECADCHTEVKADEPTIRENMVKGCIECHEATYEELFKGWEKRIADAGIGQKERIERLEKLVNKKGLSGANTTGARNLLVRVKQNRKMFENGRGLHNTDFAVKIAETNQKMLDEAESLITLGER
jgi:cytochrome c551/c552